ncbi:CvpA family protein [Patescibacteria group bacterium]
MTVIDIVLLIMLGGFTLAGLWFGVIHMIGSLIGLVIAVIVSGKLYAYVALVVAPIVGGNINVAKVLAFFGMFLIITRGIGLLVHLLEKAFKFAAIIPFLKTFEKLLGAALGLLEGTLFLGLLVYFTARFPISATFEDMLVESWMARGLNVVGSALAPLLPDAVQALRSVL